MERGKDLFFFLSKPKAVNSPSKNLLLTFLSVPPPHLQKFFMECYKAYKDGRAETDPSESWYKGEMGFFDFYIIPLTQKKKI